jgi:hypothetical protein
MAASIIEKLIYFAFVTFSFKLDLSLWTQMAEIVVVVKAFFAVMASSFVIEWSLITTFNSALFIN